jgi:hypothetical protein
MVKCEERGDLNSVKSLSRALQYGFEPGKPSRTGSKKLTPTDIPKQPSPIHDDMHAIKLPSSMNRDRRKLNKLRTSRFPPCPLLDHGDVQKEELGSRRATEIWRACKG